MLNVFVCIGSSCHLKGSYEIATALEKAVKDNNLEEKVAVSGSFCLGKCNREGVTIKVDDEIFIGVTINKFDVFFKEHILSKVS